MASNNDAPKTKKQKLLDSLLLIKRWKRQGSTNPQIAKRLDVNMQYMMKVAKDEPELRAALDQGTEELKAALEDSIYTAALKKTKRTVKTKEVFDKQGNIVTLTEVIEEDYIDIGNMIKVMKKLDSSWRNLDMDEEEKSAIQLQIDKPIYKVLENISNIFPKKPEANPFDKTIEAKGSTIKFEDED